MHHLQKEALFLSVVVLFIFGALFFEGVKSGLLGNAVKNVEDIRNEEIAKVKITLTVLSLISGVLLIVYILVRKNDIVMPELVPKK